MKNDIGVFGLGVMGQNLALNFANNGFNVSVYNRKEDGEEDILNDFITNKCIIKYFNCFCFFPRTKLYTWLVVTNHCIKV